MRFFKLALLPPVCFLGAVTAAWTRGAELEEAPPEIPPALVSGDPMEPEVTIRQRDGARIEEYRYGGRLLMVRIKPAVGPAYYLVDENGDGNLVSRLDDSLGGTIVPQWILFSW